jgi:GT2 family glycosyltransferase
MIPNLVVPVLNRYDLLQRMLSSIDYPIRHLFIIDNGAGPTEIIDIPDWVREVTYAPMPRNLGVAGSWNLGIKSFPQNNRWFFASNDMYYQKGALEALSVARTDELTLCENAPHFQTFVVGEKIVEAIGLFDEIFYPAYFEDNDYMRRIEHAGYGIRKLPIAVGHDNSSTINSDTKLMEANRQTYATNLDIWRAKQQQGLYSSYGWSLSARRLNSWD